MAFGKPQRFLGDFDEFLGQQVPKEGLFDVENRFLAGQANVLQEKINEEENISLKDRIIISIKPKLYLAAAITGIILLTYAGIKLLSPSDNGSYYSVEQITEIIESNPYDFDENLFLEALEDTMPEEVDDEIYTEEIINFLLDENIDYETIINEL